MRKILDNLKPFVFAVGLICLMLAFGEDNRPLDAWLMVHGAAALLGVCLMAVATTKTSK